MPGTGDPVQRSLRRRAAQLLGDPVGAGGPPPRAATTRRNLLAGAAAAGAGLVVAGPVGTAYGARREGPRVVVVGAGLAGLTCAYRLHRHGIDAQVSARSSRPSAPAASLGPRG